MLNRSQLINGTYGASLRKYSIGGFEIRLDAKQNKGYVINCGGLRLRWVATQASTQTSVAATHAVTPTYTFVAQRTGVETIRFSIPKNHHAEYYEPRVDRCQVAEVG